MYLVGSGASAAHDAAALNQSLLPTALESYFDVADFSVLINVRMDSWTEIISRSTPPLEEENHNGERELLSKGPIFLKLYNEFYRLKRRHTPSVETMTISQIGVKSLSLAIDV